ncbi:MAG: glycoside hydrolase family 88 protein [Treponema sp.]|nr:glycoside hydrolase family 88 protein [Treponema sp.]
MDAYFDPAASIARFSRGNGELTVKAIAERYMAANPRHDYTARPYSTRGIIRNASYRYTADFAAIFPDAPLGSYVYAWGAYEAGEDDMLKFVLIPAGPVKLWINGTMLYATDVMDERYSNRAITFALPVRRGRNDLVLRFTRTKAGFGGEFGTWLGKLDYYFFKGVGLSRLDAALPQTEGFDYTRPLSEPLPAEALPPCSLFLSTLYVPPPEWSDSEIKAGCFARLFPEAGGDCASGSCAGGSRSEARALARTVIVAAEKTTVSLLGSSSGACVLYVSGADQSYTEVFRGSGPFRREAVFQKGINHLAVISTKPAFGSWDFTVEMEHIPDSPLRLEPVNPFFAGNGRFAWIYAGIFRETRESELALFDPDALVGNGKEKTWWRLDAPDLWVRLYNENALYGHWNYPLGVTLYGLIETARYFEASGKPEERAFGAGAANYVTGHISKSVHTLDYALFDKTHFGGATVVHHLLSSIDSLDDCGSFASTMLEAAKDRAIDGCLPVADYVGDHILHRQDRLPENCFFRKKQMHHFHNNTLWADDLYMSVPFLCRYAQLKGDASLLDLAADQFAGFKKYLFLEDSGLMAHVYDFERGMNTGVPWGRGNGWTIFSLSELLAVLPPEHPGREELLAFFKTLSAACLSLQGESGMWRQVLNIASSYPETSVTAMFIASFCRGIRQGWFEDPRPYLAASEKAWRALEQNAIDKDGAIHGVCRGSEFAFNPRYYAEHLPPRVNDTHGIGIVLLAGIELLKIRPKSV